MTRFWKKGSAAFVLAATLSACATTGGSFATDQAVRLAFDAALRNLDVSDCASLTKTKNELSRIRTAVSTVNMTSTFTGKRLTLPSNFEGELTRIETLVNQSQCGASNYSRRY